MIAAHAVMPNYAITIDTVCASDVPGSTKNQIDIGKGIAIKLKDSSAICNPRMTDWIKKTANHLNMTYQLEIQDTVDSDVSSIQMAGNGVLVGGISVPTRNMYSNVELCDLNDAKAGIALLCNLVNTAELD
jgi:endoglucanase